MKRNDVVVFNYPDGDTVVVERQAESYYAIVREYEAMFNPNASVAEKNNLFRHYAPEYIQQLRMKYPGAYTPGKGREVVWQEYRKPSMRPTAAALNKSPTTRPTASCPRPS